MNPQRYDKIKDSTVAAPVSGQTMQLHVFIRLKGYISTTHFIFLWSTIK